MKSPHFLLAGLLCAGFLNSCVSLETAAPPVATLRSSNLNSSAQLESGRQLYVGKCTKCHSVEPIRDYPLADWIDDIMPEMAEKSKLTAEENASVLAYVLAVLKSPPAPPKS